ncbi:cell division protein ZapD [Escherichia coli]
MRTWLRIEFLIQQLTLTLNPSLTTLARCISSVMSVNYWMFFERGEVRTELLKELDRQQRKLQTWIGVPAWTRAVLKH